MTATRMLATQPVRSRALQLNSILVATDFSVASDRAVAAAISIARHYDAKLCILNIVTSAGIRPAAPGALEAITETAWRDMARLEQDLSVCRLLQGVEVSFRVCSGCVYEELEAVAGRESADLVVIGARGRKGLGRLFIGSVAEQVFRSSSTPVLTVGPHAGPGHHHNLESSIRPLLFATDFSRASLETLPRAISLANQLGKKLILLHVLSDTPEPGDRWFTAMDAIKVRERAEAATIEKLARLLAQEVPLNEEPAFMIEFGEPSEGIVRAAAALHAGMIVLGLTHRSHVETVSHLPWSNAYEVVCASECPVLTLR